MIKLGDVSYTNDYESFRSMRRILQPAQDNPYIKMVLRGI